MIRGSPLAKKHCVFYFELLFRIGAVNTLYQHCHRCKICFQASQHDYSKCYGQGECFICQEVCCFVTTCDTAVATTTFDVIEYVTSASSITVM